jgi:hypothetical protein
MNYAAPSGPISTHALRLMHSMSMRRVRYPVRNAWSLTINITMFTATPALAASGKSTESSQSGLLYSRYPAADALNIHPSASVSSAIIRTLPRLRGYYGIAYQNTSTRHSVNLMPQTDTSALFQLRATSEGIDTQALNSHCAASVIAVTEGYAVRRPP